MLVLHLASNPAREKALFTTMHSFNRAANTAAQIAFIEHTRSIVKLLGRCSETRISNQYLNRKGLCHMIEKPCPLKGWE